jgi:hypothetical protein
MATSTGSTIEGPSDRPTAVIRQPERPQPHPVSQSKPEPRPTRLRSLKPTRQVERFCGS